ncbi:MAG: hypothetical protein JSV56_02075 [Methanomassiliicoccales archaeon]|nr:MAG: hypothetical protein JSV56_02075 [Methanomassiliicoccales archaeon]
MDKNIKSIVLLSGGLDSSLAMRLVIDQGIVVIAVKFTSPFCTCDQGGRCFSRVVAEKMGVPYRILVKGEDYLKVVRKPKYGYGKGMNPCIDCRIYMLRKANELMEELGAKFIVTGEVVGQRPMSQYRRALQIIEREAGLEGKIVRPLSAKLLPLTEPEKEGWVDRERFLSIKGRSRKEQIELAEGYEIEEYACAAGGCLLTHREFANKLKDLFKHKKRLTWRDIMLLKLGRHFRLGANKIIVGRNEQENNLLFKLKQKTDHIFEVPGCGSPMTLLQGEKSRLGVLFAARLTALYSDCQQDQVQVKYGRNNPFRAIIVQPLIREEANRYNLTLQKIQ